MRTRDETARKTPDSNARTQAGEAEHTDKAATEKRRRRKQGFELYPMGVSPMTAGQTRLTGDVSRQGELSACRMPGSPPCGSRGTMRRLGTFRGMVSFRRVACRDSPRAVPAAPCADWERFAARWVSACRMAGSPTCGSRGTMRRAPSRLHASTRAREHASAPARWRACVIAGQAGEKTATSPFQSRKIEQISPGRPAPELSRVKSGDIRPR